ncbi:restriction endonuclease subunit S [Streptomyces sp. NPDC127033]|uniref:restriction endonuclease subunit S n=1 Tax=Streptomyces sp. NPDC127033 TaxID=3347110 RepID=UPI003664C88F
MAEWRSYTVGEVARVFDGPHATPKKTSSGPWFLSISSLDRGRLNLAESAHLSENDFVRWTRRVTPEQGDVLFSYETRLGDAALMPQGVKACLGRRMGILRPNRDRVLPRFLLLAYLSPNFQATIRSGAIYGATVDRIPLTDLPKWPIEIPDLHRQAAIVEVLGALDDKITVSERIADTAEELCRAIFSEQSWEARTTIESIASLRKEQVVPGALSEVCVAHYSLPAFDSGAMPAMVDPRSIKSSKFVVRQPSVLLSKLNPDIPRVWNVSPYRECVALASTEFLVLEPRNGVTAAELWAVLSQPGLLGGLASKVTGTSKSHQRVRPAEVMTSYVVDPRDLGDVRGQARALASRVTQARDESRALATLRDALLPQLMSGKLRVRDAEKIVEDAV